MLSNKLKNHFNNDEDTRKDIDKLAKRISNLEKESKNQKEILDSYHDFISNLYLNCDLKPKGILKQVQDLGFEILVFTDKVCKKHGLEYWIDFGTLLGAVRHKGYIPWDDDLDASMMRQDYNRLAEVLEDEVKKANLENFGFRFMKGLFLKKTAYRWIKVYYHFDGFEEDDLACLDIFPYDYIKADQIDDMDDYYLECRGNFHQRVRDNVPFEEVLDKYYEELNLSLERQDHYIMGVEGVKSKFDIYEIVISDTDELFPLSEVEFNGKTFPAPHDVPHYLEEIFGDTYMDIPKDPRTHDIISQLRKIDGIESVLDKAIMEMRKVNEDFE